MIRRPNEQHLAWLEDEIRKLERRRWINRVGLLFCAFVGLISVVYVVVAVARIAWGGP